MSSDAGGVSAHERPVGRLVPERATGAVVLREIAAMHAEGLRTLRANTLAERLWPGRRQHNANGQVFHLGSGVAARLLRKCPAVREKQWRLWEILPHRLPPNVAGNRLAEGKSELTGLLGGPIRSEKE